MSRAETVDGDHEMTEGLDWSLMRRQVAGILRLELRKNLLSRRALVLYFLAMMPVAIMALWAMSSVSEAIDGPMAASRIFAIIYASYLGTSIFLGCVIMFMSLFRAEILERSLHYYFLAPIRREVLVAGKYVAALLAVMAVFLVGTLLIYVLTFIPWGLGEFFGYLFDGPGLLHLAKYLGITALAVIGYGAVFQLAGQVMRNPVIPAVLIWGWEAINPFLPAWLKKISVIFYLKSMYPIPVTEGPFQILTDPTPIWISVPGLLLFTLVVLAIAGWKARRMEISYSGDD